MRTDSGTRAHPAASCPALIFSLQGKGMVERAKETASATAAAGTEKAGGMLQARRTRAARRRCPQHPASVCSTALVIA